jgi:hypothetical protein
VIFPKKFNGTNRTSLLHPTLKDVPTKGVVGRCGGGMLHRKKSSKDGMPSLLLRSIVLLRYGAQIPLVLQLLVDGQPV